MPKTDVKGLNLSQLEDFVLAMGEKKFRAKQLFDALYLKEIESFDEMTTLSKEFRQRLNETAMIGKLQLSARQTSPDDGTVKFLFELADGKKIESVLIPPRFAATMIANGYQLIASDIDDSADEADTADDDAAPVEGPQRLTLCVSTQVGCALDCVFCATASMGFLRNLTPGEIIDQVMQAKKISGRAITNLVFMGMGEPLMNYENVMTAIDIISNGLKIAGKRITVSTAGWVPKIRQMADEGRKIKLAISLHTLDPRKRAELMPITNKFSLDELLDAARYYTQKARHLIMFEYILFDGWNDTDEDLRKLVKLSRSIPCKFNIIPFHDIAFTDPSGLATTLKPTPVKRVEEFVERLRNEHVTVFTRSSSGEDIDAACGQLAVKAERGTHITGRGVHRAAESGRRSA